MLRNIGIKLALLGICSILLASGGLKLIDSAGTVKALDVQHPILYLTYRQVEIITGLIELALCTWCIISRGSLQSMCAVVSFSLSLMCYKVVHGILQPNEPCHCLGVLLGWWPGLKKVEDQVTWTLAFALLLLASCRLVLPAHARSPREGNGETSATLQADP